MKRFAILCGVVAALLCLSLRASAQYRPARIHRAGTHFKADDGHRLQDSELKDLVGEDIYNETVHGARFQMRLGTGLMWGGALCIGAGLAGAVYTGYKAADANFDTFWDAVKSSKEIYSLYSKTVGVLTFGTSVFAAGIPIHIIGKCRLNWVEDNYNANARDISCNFGLTPSGVGLVMTF